MSGILHSANTTDGVTTEKAEYRLVRRLKAGATAPRDSNENLIKPEIKRTYLKVTTIVTSTLDNDEAKIVFKKTPKGTATEYLDLLDKIIIVDGGQFNDSKSTVAATMHLVLNTLGI